MPKVDLGCLLRYPKLDPDTEVPQWVTEGLQLVQFNYCTIMQKCGEADVIFCLTNVPGKLSYSTKY